MIGYSHLGKPSNECIPSDPTVCQMCQLQQQSECFTRCEGHWLAAGIHKLVTSLQDVDPVVHIQIDPL